MLSLAYFTLILFVVLLACAAVVAWQARVFSKREDRWWKREEELRNQLWELAGGRKPVIKIEREKVIKVPDPEAPVQQMTAWDIALFQDDVKEEIEQFHPDAKGMSISQVKAKYPNDWKQVEAQLRAERAPIRAS